MLTAMTAFSLIPVIWVGGRAVIKGEMTNGGIAQFIVYVTMLSWPIISIGWVTSIVQKAASAQARLNEIFNTPPDLSGMENPEPSASETKQCNGSLVFRNVSFHYPSEPETTVLERISFTVEPGSKIAFVGATGSGKTTLVSLIPRLYEPASGSVLFNGRDIRTIPLDHLRKKIGFVPQNNFLFSDTIEQNISYGSSDSNPQAVIDASRIAMLDDDVESFPEQYRTMLGEKGINLSGGQKQRACIARAVAWSPEILVLDDALSAVDTATEARIFDALLQKLPETTIILISHRISTVKNCDRIFVLQGGLIAENGTHDELLRQNGLYTKLHNQQLLEDEILSLA